MFLVVQTGTIAAVAVAFAEVSRRPRPCGRRRPLSDRPTRLGHYALSLSTQQLVAVGLIVALTVTNTRGLRAGKLIQNSFTFTKTAALFGLIVVGLSLGLNPQAAAWTSSWWFPTANGWDPGQVQPGFRMTGAWPWRCSWAAR